MKVRTSCADVQAVWLSITLFRGEQLIRCDPSKPYRTCMLEKLRLFLSSVRAGRYRAFTDLPQSKQQGSERALHPDSGCSDLPVISQLQGNPKMARGNRMIQPVATGSCNLGKGEREAWEMEKGLWGDAWQEQAQWWQQMFRNLGVQKEVVLGASSCRS